MRVCLAAPSSKSNPNPISSHSRIGWTVLDLVFIEPSISSHLIQIIISSNFLLHLLIYPYSYTYIYLHFNKIIKYAEGQFGNFLCLGGIFVIPNHCLSFNLGLSSMLWSLPPSASSFIAAVSLPRAYRVGSSLLSSSFFVAVVLVLVVSLSFSWCRLTRSLESTRRRLIRCVHFLLCFRLCFIFNVKQTFDFRSLICKGRSFLDLKQTFDLSFLDF